MKKLLISIVLLLSLSGCKFFVSDRFIDNVRTDYVILDAQVRQVEMPNSLYHLLSDKQKVVLWEKWIRLVRGRVALELEYFGEEVK